MDDGNNPSADLHAAVAKALAKAAEDMISWEFVDAVTTPAYDYVKALLDARGADTYLLDTEGEELTLGVAVWDENGDYLLATQQVNFSDVMVEAAFGDPEELEGLAVALERSLAIVRARLAKEKPASHEGDAG